MHEDSLRSRRRRRQAGFSLVEMMVAMGSMTLVFGASMMMLAGTRGAWEVGGTRSSLQEVGRRMLEEVLTDVRRSGLTTTGGQNFPQIWERPVGTFLEPRGNLIATMDYTDVDLVDEMLAVNGLGGPNRILNNQNRIPNEFVFQLPTDTNGNGLPIDDDGNLTFGIETVSYRIIEDPTTGIPTLFRLTQAGAMLAGFERVGPYVTNITFDVVFNDPSLRFGEIAVVIYLQKTNAQGQVIQAALEGSVALRNTREL